jgi:trk system potassium uptake protein TrkH
MKLYVSEGRVGKIEPTIKETVREIWWIYIVYTVMGGLLLYFAGMPLFDAVNHSMTTIATGGFSTKNGSIAAYNNLTVESIIVGLMILGMMSFAVHAKLIRGHVKSFIHNVEVILAFFLIVIFTMLLSIDLAFKDQLVWTAALNHSLFQVVSALSGTGFFTADVSRWDDIAKILLTILMVTGGGFGSTSGAIKLIRMAIILQSFRWIIRKLSAPHTAIIPMKLGKKIYSEPEIMEATLYCILYFMFLLVGTILMTTLGFSFIDSLFEVASAQGNVGLSVGITSQNLNIAGKIILIFAMWAGRLEILPVIILFRTLFLGGKAGFP